MLKGSLAHLLSGKGGSEQSMCITDAVKCFQPHCSLKCGLSQGFTSLCPGERGLASRYLDEKTCLSKGYDIRWIDISHDMSKSFQRRFN
jgi:hypothetical protein